MISGQFKTLSIVKGFLVHFLREIKKLCYKKYMKMARCKSVPLYKANTREFKIRRLRTTTTVKHATAYDQNHVTVHFFRVVLRLRWVVELFRVVATTENNGLNGLNRTMGLRDRRGPQACFSFNQDIIQLCLYLGVRNWANVTIKWNLFSSQLLFIPSILPFLIVLGPAVKSS